MATTANDIRDELDAQLSNIIGANYDAVSADIKAGLLQAVANTIHVVVVGGVGEFKTHDGFKVSFVAGQFAGTDDAGDVPNNVTASGGIIT